MEERDSFSITITNTVRMGGRFAAWSDVENDAIRSIVQAPSIRIDQLEQVRDHATSIAAREKPSPNSPPSWRDGLDTFGKLVVKLYVHGTVFQNCGCRISLQMVATVPIFL